VTFIDDFASAVSSYPSTSVTLSIVDVAVQTGTTGAVNVNEVWKYQVRVANNGHLNMTGVTLHIEGQNGAQVSTAAAGPWSTSIFPGGLNINSHSIRIPSTSSSRHRVSRSRRARALSGLTSRPLM
jgi:hypothetical protein